MDPRKKKEIVKYVEEFPEVSTGSAINLEKYPIINIKIVKNTKSDARLENTNLNEE